MPRDNLSAGYRTELARLSGREPLLYPLELWVPLYPATNTVRIVHDTDSLTLTTGETFHPGSYEIVLPNDVDRQVSTASLRFDSPRDDLIKLIEDTNGAQGAVIRIYSTRRSNPVKESEFIIEAQNISVDSTGVSVRLAFPDLIGKAALNQRYEARTARGYW